MSYTYLVTHKGPDGQLCGPVKVGITTSLRSRLRALQTGSPSELVMAIAIGATDTVGARAVEQRFHRTHDGSRLVGEWFDLDPALALVGLCVELDDIEIDDHTLRTLATELGVLDLVDALSSERRQ